MRLNRLAVTDYRNLSAAVLEPAPQLTVLCGSAGFVQHCTSGSST